MKKLTLILFLIISVCLNADWNEIEKILASDGDGGDRFGYSVSISGDYAVIGSYGDDSYTGSAYIFHRTGTTWSEQAKLTASDGGTGKDQFGRSVSISGDYAVIGAMYDNDNGEESGSAYIFHRIGTTWSQQAKIFASNGGSYDHFGCSVSISGDYAVIGAYSVDNYDGFAYIFHRTGTTWSQQVSIPGASFSYFGRSVSIFGDYAVIGAFYENNNGLRSGSAYIFHRIGTTWSEQAKVTASDGAAYDYFGYSVSISGDYAVIGAIYDTDNGDDSGSAYIFHRIGSTWFEQAKITASDGAIEDYFGWSVSISANYTMIGAYGDDDNGSQSGSSYIFHRNGTTWTEQEKITVSDGASGDQFGRSVSISGDYAVIGSYGDDDNGSASGSAYIFHNDGLAVEDEIINSNTMVIGNYPNPFNPTTTVYFSIQETSKINLSIYNVEGQKIKTLIHNEFAKGSHSIIWNGEDDNGKPVSSGIYYYKLNVNSKTEAVNKCLMLK